MTRSSLLTAVSATALLSFAGPALADSITPDTYTGTTGIGGTLTLDKTVVVSAGMPTTATADVFFLVDTTGSMGAAIGALQSNLSSVASSLSALGNFSFGAGQYKDNTSDGGDGFDYQLNQDITTSVAAVQTAINGFSASGGGDNPEQGLNGLSQVATTTTWDSGAKKIVIIAGDAPSHSSPSHPPAANGVSVGSVATTLSGAGVTMVALNVGRATTGAAGLGGDSSNGLNAYGQFAGGSGLLDKGVTGSYFDAIPDAATLTADIESAVGTAFATYSDVSLDLIGPAPSCVSVSLPADKTGSFTRSTDNSFDFTGVTFTGMADGTCTFTIAAETDGAIIAEETDTITIGSVPEPATLALFGSGLVGLALARRRKKRG